MKVLQLDVSSIAALLAFPLLGWLPMLPARELVGGPQVSQVRDSVAIESQLLQLGTNCQGETTATVAGPDHDLVIVPNVIGSICNAAASKLTAADLKMNARFDETLGIAVRQSPRPNSVVKKGSSVIVVFSSDNAFVRVPNVIGRLPELAEDMLNAVGLRMEARGDIGHGTAVCQSPSAGRKVRRGSIVIVVFQLSGTTKCNLVARPM